MGDLTENFSRKEFACQCGCGCDSVDYATLTILQVTRNAINSPIWVTSAHRCFSHNRSVGSNDQSQHPLARAVDTGYETDSKKMEAYEFLTTHHPEVSLGLYDWGIHIDTRTDGPARWEG